MPEAEPTPAPAPTPAVAPAAAPASSSPETSTATAVVIENALSSAEGTRKAAQWIASALAGIPSLAIVASIVSGPGDNGFDPTELGLGIGLAAVGVLLGILFFARVLTPLSLEDFNLEGFPMARVPDSPCDTYAELEAIISSFHSTLASGGTRLADAKWAAEKAGAEASVADRAQTVAMERTKDKTGGDSEKERREQELVAATIHAEEKHAAAESAAGEFKARTVTYERSQGQLVAAETLRADVYRLKTADEVRIRFNDARRALVVIVAFVAAGLVLVGIAPKEDPPAATAPSLVTLTLEPAGQKKIGCSVASLQALKVGGDEKTPVVITLPAPGCPSRTVNFTTTDPEPLGKVTPVEPIKAE